MRLRRLDLTRYGRFTDSSFELPAAKSDLHIVFGPNEAGKSTVLAAIEDLLFGIPMHSPYSFSHDYGSMRIGADLQNGSASLEVLRRKGNRNTLLGTNGLPIVGGEGALRPYLSDADRSFFERMFSLDHARLQAGGREILQAEDDVGQMLFSAGVGIVGLRERLNELCSEAENLWSARRAKHRKFYIARDELKEAERTLREKTITASKWRELKRAYEGAEEAYAKVDKKIKEASIEGNRLSRIRRVFQDVRRKEKLDDQLAKLGEVTSLPEDAGEVVEESDLKDKEKAIRIATLQEQLKQAQESLEGLTFDETLVQRDQDVRQLYERRIEIRRQKADLPKREAELKTAEEELRTNASELGWTETDSSTLLERIPRRTEVRVARSLLIQRSELEAAFTSYTRELRLSQANHDELKKRLDKTGEPADVSRLAVVIRTLREQGDLTDRVRTAEQAVKDAQGFTERRLKTLNPSGIDDETLMKIAVPRQAMVQEYRDREQDWKRRLRETEQRISSVQQELDAAVTAFDRATREELVVTGEELNEARSHRDALWHLVKVTHVQGEPIPEDQASCFEKEPEDLAGGFESAMTKADDLADRRFDHAEAAGRITEIKRKVGEHEMLLEQEKKKMTRFDEEGKQLETEWASMWAPTPFDPLAAEAMLEWLHVRDGVLESVEERKKAESALEARRNEERKAREQLLKELSTLGVALAPLEMDGLNVIIELAAEEQRVREIQADKKAQLEENVENAMKDVARRKRDLQQTKEIQNEWERKWTVALGKLGLTEDTALEAIGVQVDVIDQMRETTGRIRSLKHDRIGKIKRNINDFNQVVREMISDVAGDLAEQPAENAVLELEKRLAEAEHVQGLREEKNDKANELTAQIAKLEDERQVLAASISHLKSSAGVETNEALKEAINRSDQQRTLECERQQIIDKLKQDGDGKSVVELAEECENTVIDEVVAHGASIRVELEDLHEQQTNVAEERSRTREAFQAVGGDDAAAQAAASKQGAVAEIREVAERYVRVKTSAMLLQWVIECYRREKQGPLLKRAGALFKIITSGSFARLQVEFDDQDNMHLTGARPGGQVVPVSGMSAGTADQLYLVLRVASVEDYLERADTLPFVADDLFINFDDERAEAGFRLLGELSKKTQVLFFTHHQHLVDIARKTLGDSLNLVTLADQEETAA